MADATDDLAALTAASQRFSSLVHSIGAPAADRWAAGTPCDDWTVRDLVDHVVGGHVFTIEILGGATADEAMHAAYEAVAVADIASIERATSAAQARAFDAPGALDRTCHHAVGTIGGDDVLRLRIHEIVIHGWDLAVGLGADSTIPDDLVAWAIAELDRPGSLTADHIATPAAPTGPALLSAFGRDPGTAEV